MSADGWKTLTPTFPKLGSSAGARVPARVPPLAYAVPNALSPMNAAVVIIPTTPRMLTGAREARDFREQRG